MAKTISISDMIRDEIRAAIRSELGMGNDDVVAVRTAIDRASVDAASRTVASAAAAPPATVRRRRRGGPNVAYAIANPITDPENFTDGVMTVYKAMTGRNGRNRKAMTEAEIIAAVGRKDGSAKKAVQSAVWFMRNHDANGNRLDLNDAKAARKAVVVNHRAGE